MAKYISPKNSDVYEIRKLGSLKEGTLLFKIASATIEACGFYKCEFDGKKIQIVK